MGAGSDGGRRAGGLTRVYGPGWRTAPFGRPGDDPPDDDPPDLDGDDFDGDDDEDREPGTRDDGDAEDPEDSGDPEDADDPGDPGGLLPGGRLVVRGHWRVLALPVLVLYVTSAACGFLLSTDPDPDGAATRVVTVCTGVVLLRWTVLPWLRWLTTTHEVTARTLSLRSGIVAVEETVVPLASVAGVACARDRLADRVTGSGTLTVRAEGEPDDLVLASVPDAERLRATLLRLAREAPAAAAEDGPRPTRGTAEPV